MSLSLRVGDPAHTLKAAATDAAGQPDPNNPVIAWTVDNASAVEITDHGDGTCSVTALAEGNATIVADAKDPDGHSLPSAPFAVAVAANTDATMVTITDLGAAAPAASAPAAGETPAPAASSASAGDSLPPPS